MNETRNSSQESNKGRLGCISKVESHPGIEEGKWGEERERAGRRRRPRLKVPGTMLWDIKTFEEGCACRGAGKPHTRPGKMHTEKRPKGIIPKHKADQRLRESGKSPKRWKGWLCFQVCNCQCQNPQRAQRNQKTAHTGNNGAKSVPEEIQPSDNLTDKHFKRTICEMSQEPKNTRKTYEEN